ncbi:MAG: serine/threonine protein kinase [Verrucomicrobiae bacterium]|nr:serine/threonine protein kinase [Verrucomicrobiae bacterium]
MNPQQIIELFNEALAMPSPAARAVFLDEACRGEPEAREQIEALLGAGQRAAPDFLKPLAPGSSPLAKASLEKPGDRIGRYKLLEKLGEGGCGVVYLAQQEEPVRRQVALKIIKLGMDTRQVIARFEAERQALALMDHPNIARIFDAGVTGSAESEISNLKSQIHTGRPYFVMELVRGIKITEFCRQNHLSTHERLKLFIQVCDAIQHAHQKGIIHRDLKPSNILVTVTHPGAAPCPKVIDFGIAKATTDQPLADKTVFTAFAQFLGTPAYMSPEQATLTSLDVDTRSDIYSLGVLLYELLTGVTPFDQKELLEAGLDEMRRTIREKTPLKPSTRLTQEFVAASRQSAAPPSGENGGALPSRRYDDTRSLIHALRGELDWIVMKCLEKDRVRRYETANGLAADIERHLNCEPVVARPPSRLYEFQKTVRRHKVGFAATTAVILSLAGGLGVSLWIAAQERRAREAAVDAEEKAATVATFLKEIFEGLDPSVARERDTMLLKEILEQTAARIEKELKHRPGVEAEVRAIIGGAYMKIERLDEAEVMQREALRLARAVWGNDDIRVGIYCCWLGRTLSRQAKLKDAAQAFRESMRIHKSHTGDENNDIAILMVELSGVLVHLGKLEEAAELLEGALAVKQRLLGSENFEVASTLNNLANVRHYQRRLDDAEELMEKVLAIDQKLLPPIHPNLAQDLHNLASLRHRRGKLAQAEELYLQALAIEEKIYGGEHTEIATLLHNLATLLRQDGRLADAEEREMQAIAMHKKIVKGPHPFMARYLGNLALILAAQGRLEDAEVRAQEGLSVCTNLFEYNHADVAAALEKLARVRQQRNKLPEAESAARQAVSILERTEPTRTYTAQGTLGGILLAQGRYADAEEPLRAGCEGFVANKATLDVSGNADFKDAMKNLARLYQALKQPEPAAEWQRKLAEFEQREAESAEKK